MTLRGSGWVGNAGEKAELPSFFPGQLANVIFAGLMPKEAQRLGYFGESETPVPHPVWGKAAQKMIEEFFRNHVDPTWNANPLDHHGPVFNGGMRDDLSVVQSR